MGGSSGHGVQVQLGAKGGSPMGAGTASNDGINNGNGIKGQGPRLAALDDDDEEEEDGWG